MNLITAETLEDAADELREALSDEGMARYVSFRAGHQASRNPDRNRRWNRRTRLPPTAGTPKMSVLPLLGHSAEVV